MNGSLTMLALVASLGGPLPPEHIPPAEVPAAAYQGLDCAELMQAAEVVGADLSDAWDRQEMLVRGRFGAPPPIVRRSELKVSQLKGELEIIWRIADRQGCGEAAQPQDMAWAPGREPGPMLGEAGPTFEPPAQPLNDASEGPEAEAAYAEDAPADPRAMAPGPDAEMTAAGDDLAGGPPPEEPGEVEGYGDPDPEPQAEPAPRPDAGPARWPSISDRGPAVASGQRLDDVDWPTARPVEPVDRDSLPAARRR